jgi:aldehyde:ferredoxin oxidoreductase
MSGFVGSPRGGAENTEGICAIIGVNDPATAVVMTDFFEGLGVESNQFHTVMRSMYESFADGLLTLEDTDGLDLTWGNWETAMELLSKAIQMEGIGGRLVNETRALPETLTGEDGLLEKMRDRVLEVAGESDSRIRKVRESQYATLFYDSLGVCNFGVKGVSESLRLTSECLGQTVGWDDFDSDEALLAGERVINLMRLIYSRRGYQNEIESDSSVRFHRLMGWDLNTGNPTAETLTRLGMDEFAQSGLESF